jgi:glycosyltransferase involved in cell wall biosynthesis
MIAGPRSASVPRSVDPLSIMHVAAPAHFGGLESVVRELARGQLRRGHTVSVVLVLSPEDRPHPLALALEADGVTAVPLYVGNRDYRGERRAIRALCRQHRPDILHSHGYRCDVVDGTMARSEGVRAVSTCHGFIESSWSGRLQQWLQRRALRRFDAVVAVSRAIQQRLLESGIEPERIHVVPNALATGQAALSREEARQVLALPSAPVIGWVGRLSDEKGPDIALDAFALLGLPGVNLVFLGTGREADRLHARAATLGVSNHVIWRGSVPNAGTLLRAFDVFLLSSRTEGTPMALLEAIAAGVPVVATRVGGVPDVVDSTSAYLVESGDVDGIAAALREVLENPDASQAKAERASKFLEERFAVEPWLSSYESIYRGLGNSLELPR